MHATIIMEGRLVTDPEIKSGKNGDYCTFRFVVNTKYGNQDNASFFNCTANEYIANRMQKAGIKKGRLIEIIGNLNLASLRDGGGHPSDLCGCQCPRVALYWFKAERR